MKKPIMTALIITAFALIGNSAFANDSDWMTCTIGPSGLDTFDLVTSSGNRPISVKVGANLNLHGQDSTEDNAFIKAKIFDSMSRTGRFDIVLESVKSLESDGIVKNAALLTLIRMNKKGDYVGKLSRDGNVYSLKCKENDS